MKQEQDTTIQEPTIPVRKEDTCYDLHATEFLLMAQAAGITHFYGPNLQQKALEEEELVSAFWQMAAKGLIRADGDVFRMEEPYRSLFEEIRDAQEMLTIRSSRRELPTKVVYCGRRTWMLETDPYAPRRIRCRCIERAELIQILDAQEYLPQLLRRESAGIYEEVSEAEWEPSGSLAEGGNLSEDPAFRLAVEKRVTVGTEPVCVRRLVLLKEPDGYRVEIQEEGRKKTIPYDRMLFQKEMEAL